MENTFKVEVPVGHGAVVGVPPEVVHLVGTDVSRCDLMKDTVSVLRWQRAERAYGNEQKLQELADNLNARGYRKVANTIERFLPGLMSYTAFPKEHWKRIRTTNVMERINRELKRRTKVVGVFPNEGSLLQLVGSILMDTNEEWVTGRRFLTMEEE